MKRIAIAAFLVAFTGVLAFALTLPAEVDGGHAINAAYL